MRLSHGGGDTLSRLYQLTTDTPYPWTIGSEITPTNVVGNVNEYVLGVGYYLAVFDVTLGSAVDISYRSDGFVCPFHTDYIDGRDIFQFCNGGSGSAPVVDMTPVSVPVFGDPLLYNDDRIGTDPIHDLGSLVAGDTAAFTI